MKNTLEKRDSHRNQMSDNFEDESDQTWTNFSQKFQ